MKSVPTMLANSSCVWMPAGQVLLISALGRCLLAPQCVNMPYQQVGRPLLMLGVQCTSEDIWDCNVFMTSNTVVLVIALFVPPVILIAMDACTSGWYSA